MEQTNSNNFIQDRTISATTGKTLRIFLSNGLSYYGQVYAYDTYSVVFLPCELKDGTVQRSEKTVLIYKSSISAIEVYDKIEERIDTRPYVNKTNAQEKAFQKGRQVGMRETLDKIKPAQKGKSKSGNKKKKNNKSDKPSLPQPPALTNPDDVDFEGAQNNVAENVMELPDVTLEMTDENEQPSDDVPVDEGVTTSMDTEQSTVDDEQPVVADDVPSDSKTEQPDEEKNEENKVDKMMEEMFSFKG